MLVLITVMMAVFAAAAVLYPFLRDSGRGESTGDEGSFKDELDRRWDAAVAGLKNAELEWGLGNLAENDYQWLRRQYMREAALLMRAMELEPDQEEELLETVRLEVQHARLRAVGPDGEHERLGQTPGSVPAVPP